MAGNLRLLVIHMIFRYVAVLALLSLPIQVCTADGKSNLRFSEIEHFPSNEVHNSNALPFHFAFQAIQTVHPIIIAGLMLFLVLGACFLMTDEKEIELYLKIDYRPPKTDILN